MSAAARLISSHLPTIRQLQCFLAVAQELNFRRAAERLSMTQPPLTRQIQRLEDLLGQALFDRKTHSLTLTRNSLGVERIDLFYLHPISPATPIKESMPCLSRLVQDTDDIRLPNGLHQQKEITGGRYSEEGMKGLNA